MISYCETVKMAALIFTDNADNADWMDKKLLHKLNLAESLNEKPLQRESVIVLVIAFMMTGQDAFPGLE
jgi:hypothetical protein